MFKKLTTQTIALCGMMAAIIFIATYALKIPVGTGYIHLGDGFILLAASMLGWPAVLAAALGSMMADLLAGYTIYMIPTFLIKGGVAAIAVLGYGKEKYEIRLLLMLAAEILMVVGYFVSEWLILGYGLAAAVSGVIGNTLQALSGVAIWVLLIPVVKRLKKQA